MLLRKLLSAALPFGVALGMSACGSDDASSPIVPPAPVPPSPSVGDPTPTVPPPSTQTYGILPTTANAVVAMGWYEQWKATYFKTYQEEASKYPSAPVTMDWNAVFGPYLAAGLMPGRVVWDANDDAYCLIEGATDSYKKRGCTVSEGIGYGMLLSYFASDYNTLNALWTYNKGYRSYLGTSNLMPWKMGTYSYESLTSAANTSSVTDADLDIATSLILTYYATGVVEYLNDALLIVNDMWDKEISPTKLIYSGDTPTWKRETSAYNLSYFSPVALKLFDMVDPNPAHDWTGVLNTMYDFMLAVQAAGTGVFPDWVDYTGKAINPNNHSADKTYWMFHQESVRIPWRIAWDYYWTQDPRAAQVLNTLNAFIAGKTAGDPANLETAGRIQYSAVPGMEDGLPNKNLLVHWQGAWCLTGMAGQQAWLDNCTAIFNTRTISGFNYFPHILQTMYGELLNGLFKKPAALSM
ncbi:MAG: glycosyl hydrolase family 8 [Fibrobacter sp.]|nr:glycosyl hydrolase family 8 [Fibrobacter sp.]